MWINLKEQTGKDFELNTNQIVGTVMRKLKTLVVKGETKLIDCGDTEVPDKWGVSIITPVTMISPFALFDTEEQAIAFRKLLSGD